MVGAKGGLCVCFAPVCGGGKERKNGGSVSNDASQTEVRGRKGRVFVKTTMFRRTREGREGV